MRIKIKASVIFLILLFLLTTGLSCGSAPAVSYESVVLEYWGVWEEPNDIRTLINDYRAIYPNVTINYRKFRFEEYEKELIEAFAQDRGPDIYSIHNTWVNKYQTLISPLPAQTQVARKITEGDIRKKESVINEVKTSLAVKDAPKIFPEVVTQDVIWTQDGVERIFGLPISLDTLVLFYNRDLLNNANIAQPARNWEDFISQAQQLTQKDSDGNILISGVALGTANNIVRSFDILSLLMMQNRAVMADKQGNVLFNQKPAGSTSQLPPGQEALTFYTGFSQIDSGFYTWNEDMPNSLDAFITGQTAYFFGYAYHIPVIDSRAPKLNYDIAGTPQIYEDNRTNYANYWVETVSKKTKNVNHAWNFIQFITSPDEARKYLASSKRPTALRALINEQLNDPDLDVFADQLLTAQSWYRGKDSAAAESVFADLINDVLSGEKIKDAIDLAAQRIKLTWKE
ncbi:MAG TPA: extracellular solute-binding protein [Candidatus Bipolaricaulota bacterium]|nr:extracellular solute-binding protein [Candidatus Bipolaricaulota bacterium]